MKRWILYNKKADFHGMAEKFGVDPLIIKIIRNRDVIGEEETGKFLNATKEPLYDPKEMKDMELAADFILEAKEKNERIRIISDYDVDGIMSNYVLYKGLKRIGADVDYEIPDRKKDGYGLNEHLLANAKEDGIDMIVTCDNGIAAKNEIAYANQLGMKVVVTDHHEIPFEVINGQVTEEIPQALAVVDPKRKDCSYPYKQLCGCAVAFKLISVLYEKEGINQEELEQFLPYVSIATVCDVVDLNGENRSLVKKGISKLQDGCDAGLKALFEENQLDYRQAKAYHFGFVIGPCLNAGGRLDTAKKGLNLLLEEDMDKAKERAKELTALNQQRKEMTNEGVKQAKQIAESEEYKNDKVLVIYLPQCHESIAGIIAGRIRETYYKPVLIITDGENDAKGSGRSIEEYSMFEKLSECKELFIKYGGHPMAAGFSLKKENIEPLRKFLNEHSGLEKEDITEKIKIDAAMPIEYITPDLIRQLELLEPFGKANNKPVFAQKNVNITGMHIFGEKKNVIRLDLLTESGCRVNAVYFGEAEMLFEEFMESRLEEYEMLSQGKKCNIKASVLYYPTVNEYNGKRSIQLKLLGIK